MRKTMYITAVLWIVSLLLAAPELVGAHVDVGGSVAICNRYPADWGEWYGKFRVMFNFIVLFACPLVVITVFYAAIAFTLLRRSHGSFRRVCDGDPAMRQLKSRRKVSTQHSTQSTHYSLLRTGHAAYAE